MILQLVCSPGEFGTTDTTELIILNFNGKTLFHAYENLAACSSKRSQNLYLQLCCGENLSTFDLALLSTLQLGLAYVLRLMVVSKNGYLVVFSFISHYRGVLIFGQNPHSYIPRESSSNKSLQPDQDLLSAISPANQDLVRANCEANHFIKASAYDAVGFLPLGEPNEDTEPSSMGHDVNDEQAADPPPCFPTAAQVGTEVSLIV